MAAGDIPVTINLDNYLALKAVSQEIYVSFTNDLLFLITDANASSVTSPSWGLLPAGSLRVVYSGQKMVVKANLVPVEDTTEGGIGQFTITRSSDTAYCTLHGTVMSLIYGDNAEGQWNVPAYAFMRLFSGCDIISGVLTPNIFFGLGFTFGAYSCRSMFSGCTNLRIGPTLQDHDASASACFYGMYSGCSNLLMATTTFSGSVGNTSYASMFEGCSSLPLSVVLPATGFASTTKNAYRKMFYGCNKINSVELKLSALPGDSSNISEMLYGVADTGTIKVTNTVKNSESTLRSQTGLPSGWTVTTI